MKQNKTAALTQGALIAAVYVVLTLAASALGLSSMAIQLRLSEALCVLPCFFPAAVPGLTLGCLLANLLTGGVVWDMIFGTLATLLGAVGTRLLRRHRFLAVLPPVVANTVMVPPVLAYVYQLPYGLPFLTVTVGLGEVLSCGVLGSLLYGVLDKHKNSLSR